MVTAWNSSILKAGTPSFRTYTLTIPFSSTTSTYSFALTNVYAPSDHSETNAFFSEFRNVQTQIYGAWITIGDYNLTRSPSDKNNDNFNWTLASRFNGLIDELTSWNSPF